MQEQLLEMDRDPRDLNIHAEVVFSDVFGEPNHVESLSCSWKFSKTLFQETNKLWYKILSTVCGIPAAFCWGLEFGCLAFNHVWCSTPSQKACSIALVPIQRVYAMVINALMGPCCELIGMCAYTAKNGASKGSKTCDNCPAQSGCA